MTSYYEHTLNPPGKRPEWLRDGDVLKLTNYYGDWITPATEEIKGWAWKNIGAIRIPSDHPAVPCLKWNAKHPELPPFKPWLGGDAAPADWDGGDVLYFGGDVRTPFPGGIPWIRDEPLDEVEIIGYRPKPTEQTQAPSPGEVAFERIKDIRCEFEAADLDEGEAMSAICAILAGLEPKVDPLVEVLRQSCEEVGTASFEELAPIVRTELAKRGLAIIKLAKEQN